MGPLDQIEQMVIADEPRGVECAGLRLAHDDFAGANAATFKVILLLHNGSTRKLPSL